MSPSTFSLDDWLYYLENAHKQEIQLGLSRISTVAKRLGVLDWDAQVITVAGTNGKGSTVASLEAIYAAAGYSVACYTSPHLLVFNERIRVNQQLITDEQLCAAFKVIENTREGIHLTYFEMATLAALLHFKECQPDLIILEVGVGGRLDATNIIDADLAIITTVDFDHQEYLGYTKDAIGYEKAGILRPNTPFIYADNHPPASVVEQSLRLNATLYCLGRNYSFKVTTHPCPTSRVLSAGSRSRRASLDPADKPRDVVGAVTSNALQLVLPTGDSLTLPLPKINHKAAAAACIASVCLQSILPVTTDQLALAMSTVSIQGRQHLVPGAINTVFDVAHNPQAVSLLADFIRRLQPKGRVHAVFSGLKDKDLSGLIKPMLSCVDVWYPALLSGKRAASEALLLSVFANEDCFVLACFSRPEEAYQAAIQGAEPGDLIVVYGSFLTVSAIMKIPNRMELEELQ